MCRKGITRHGGLFLVEILTALPVFVRMTIVVLVAASDLMDSDHSTDHSTDHSSTYMFLLL